MDSANRSTPFYFAIAITLIITIHLLLGLPNLLAGPILGLPSVALVTGISYLILLIFFLLFVFNNQKIKKLVGYAKIDFENPRSYTALLLLVSLLFFIFIIQILTGIATLFDLIGGNTLPEIAEKMAGQITTVDYYLSTVLIFFISFFGPLAYVGLAKDLNIKKSFEVLKLKFEKRSLLYALLGAATLCVVLVSLSTFWTVLQNIFEIEPEANVVAIDMGSGLTIFSAFIISLLTAFGEELFFRGFLQNRAGVIPTAIIFTLAHVLPYANVGAIIQIFITSLIMGYGVKKTDDLGFAIGMHFTNNFVTFIAILYFL